MQSLQNFDLKNNPAPDELRQRDGIAPAEGQRLLREKYGECHEYADDNIDMLRNSVGS